MINGHAFPGEASDIDYEKEYEVNNAFLYQGARLFDRYLKNSGVVSNSASGNLSAVRAAELLNSATQDIIRYAIYHPISKGKNGRFSISESVRASYLTKWIMIFKPLNMDQDLTNTQDIIALGKVSRETTCNTDDERFNLLYNCNEYFALYVASAILKLKINGQLKTVLEYLRLTNSGADSLKNEVNSLLYNLRYRIKHQDVYHLFYNRLLHGKTIAPCPNLTAETPSGNAP
ncbi:MAG: hypothetical protein WC091_04680 [Sulfuricellaceae bacterium]